MHKEIGSNFWFSPEEADATAAVTSPLTPEVFGYHGTDFVFLSTGRSAISFVIKTIEERNPAVKKIVCVPSFSCHTVYEPFISAGYKVVPMPMDRNMRSAGYEIEKSVIESGAGIVLLHRYFGFDTLPGIEATIDRLRHGGVVIIEDCTQSLYSDFAPINGDYHIASIRKWCGVPDGGFAVCAEGIFNDKPLESDLYLESLKREASELKYRYMVDSVGEKQVFLDRYGKAEAALDAQTAYFRISPLSERIQTGLNVDEVRVARRDNYTRLLAGLNGIEGVTPVFSELGDDVTPLYFPVYCDDRLNIQLLLRNHDIYAPIIWPKNTICPTVCAETEYAYDHMLCIPIDQRYDCDDIDRIIKVLKDALLWTGWMTWEEIEPFKQQIVDWEEEVIVRWHYPDIELPRSFSEERVARLGEYLDSGNTFFWGAVKGGSLVGYYWAYISDFLFERTWNERSSYIREDMRGRGLGLKSKVAALEMARSKCCVKAKTMYAPFNGAQKRLFETLGYYVSRVEVVKKLDSDE